MAHAPPAAPALGRAQQVLALAVMTLLVGWWLRTASLQPFSRLLHHDEAWYGLNAVDLIAHPRLVTFFPENYGRESGWMYLLAGWISVFGQDIAGLRILAALVGVLTLATVYRLGRELADAWTGLFSLMVMAILFWHVMVSQHIVRLNFALLMTCAAVLVCVRALRLGGRGRWVGAGLLTGALAYTYFAAFGVIALLGLAGGATAWRRPELRPSIALAALVAAGVMAPQAVFAVTHPEAFGGRPATVAHLDASGIATNSLAWLRAWWIEGDPDAHYNLPQRPVLDLPASLAAVVAMVTTGVAAGTGRVGGWRWRWAGVGVLVWWLVGLLPSLITAGAPNFARAALAIPAVALLVGHGLRLLRDGLAARLAAPRWLHFLPVTLLLPLAITGAIDLHQRWIDLARRSAFMEAPLMDGIERVAGGPAAQPVYFVPFTADHPVLRFMAPRLSGHPLGAFSSAECVVLSDRAARYIVLTEFDGLATRFAPWARATLREQRVELAGLTVFDAAPDPRLTEALARPGLGQFADQIEVWVLALDPADPQPGQRLTLTLAMRVSQSPTAPLGVFAHVYGDPPPEAGGRLWAQADGGVCDSYPPDRWRRAEVILKTVPLDLPADLPPGPYQLAVGLYTYPAIERLPLTRPDPGATTLPVHTWTVP